MYKGHDKTIVNTVRATLLNSTGEELSRFLDGVYAKFKREYHFILTDAVCAIEDESETEYKRIEENLSKMGDFGPRRVRSMIEYSDAELENQLKSY